MITDAELTERIRARLQELGRSPITAAVTGGLERSYLRDLLNGRKKTVKRDAHPGIAKGLDWTEEELRNEVAGPSPQLIRPSGPEISNVQVTENAPALSQLGDFDVEVRGIASGGADDEFHFNGEIDGLVRRPPGIRRAKNVFALTVSGTSMWPRYEDGELIYVQRAHAAIDDFVVVELYPETEGQAGKSFVKQLVRRTGLRVTCKQFNPAKEVEFDAGEVKEIYRVLKPRDLLG
ncbi:Phage repressor protein C, contains Cro/C1-type HTH and peptisase s24 domains [Bradyrhizobium sp. NFR13]|uniref:S24 family peptidase n=1 Tax=Bradyrhizobium sp. NFR13 TaxID=1566285 RepID=UPI0008E4DBD6|nr:S24 family peptidase [Bradyrhizobium sp. NFR13]SFM00069.1 Phage repressor protein C, contains Cro/C1-type HTH and peptisase s24 domains [Bradyrhizobium sp. NFR13]